MCFHKGSVTPKYVTQGVSLNKPLNTKMIQNLKPGDGFRSDTGENRGLRISCGNGGTKTFIYRFRSPIDGKLTQVSLGHFPSLTLAEARVELHKLKELRKSGMCPAVVSRKKKHEIENQRVFETSKKLTLKDVVEFYLSQHIEDRVVDGVRVPGARIEKGQKEVRRMFTKDLYPVLGNYPALDIKRSDVVDAVMRLVNRGANVQAGSLLRELSAAFDYAIGLDKLPEDHQNPAEAAKKSLARAKIRLSSERGSRFLSDPEIKKLLAWLPGSKYTNTHKSIILMALWTGCRTGEICPARWDDIDLEKGTWHLKATKTETERDVYLPTQAIAFLKQLSLVESDYLFPTQKTRKPIQQKQISEQAWRLREDGQMIDLPHWTPHDLRRTVRTGLAKLGCPTEVAEAVLGHSKKGIVGPYDLYSYATECRTWLQKWADHLDELRMA